MYLFIHDDHSFFFVDLDLTSSISAPSSISFCSFLKLSSSSIDGKNIEVINASKTPDNRRISGIGRSSSAARDEKIVTVLAIRLHMPIAVAFL